MSPQSSFSIQPTPIANWRKLYVSKMVGVTGLEPVTPSLSSWCSSQLS